MLYELERNSNIWVEYNGSRYNNDTVFEFIAIQGLKIDMLICRKY